MTAQTRAAPVPGPIWVWGAGGHATSILEILVAGGWHVAGVIDPFHAEPVFAGAPVYKQPPFAADAAVDAVVAIGDNAIRRRLFAEIIRDHPGARLPSLCHPSASVAHNARLGAGTVVFQNATVGSAAAVEAGCVINSAASLDHESRMGEFSSLAPGAIVGGRAILGANVFIGLGARVLQGRQIVDDVVVGAAALVLRDLDRSGAYWGQPAEYRASYEEIRGFLSR